ncbi:MAG: class I SAM-dependent methyltransferase [Candidatus Aminicenantales bacterium]
MKISSPLINQKAAYDQIFRDTGLQETLSHYKWILKKCLIDAPETKSVLDVGCGAGLFLALAEKRFRRCYGLDLSEEALKKARNTASSSYFLCGAGEELPFPNKSFDFIFSLGSLEHFLDLRRAIKEIVRVLKNDGQAFILLPNSFFLPIIFNVLLKGKRGLKSFQPREVQATREEWRQLLEENGLKIIRTFAYNYSTPNDPCLYRLMRPFIPFNLAYCFLFQARKS